ncbi:MAG: precorrin-8X methylmutase [Synechococcaceae cyanobacterium]|nr:precorrin-8X methylmutase [Synechococcaceae cyanobacterium]
MGSEEKGGSGGAAPFDHPILQESLAGIRSRLGSTGLGGIEQEVLERLVHSCGDPAVAAILRFSPGACAAGLAALGEGAPILTDTAMAAAAVAPMARRTFANPVRCLLDWAPPRPPAGSTRSAAGMGEALRVAERSAWPPPVVLIGSAPTALERLLELTAGGQVRPPALVIGMPVGFVGVRESKRRLAASGLRQIRVEGTRGGAGMAAAAANALLRRAWLDQAA